MTRTVDMEKERRKKAFEERLKRQFRTTGQWIMRNKEMIIFLTPIIVKGTTSVVKVVGKSINNKKAEDLKTLFCYDRSLGHYWELKRKLTNKEWVEIDSRKRNGERLADILSEMNVLK